MNHKQRFSIKQPATFETFNEHNLHTFLIQFDFDVAFVIMILVSYFLLILKQILENGKLADEEHYLNVVYNCANTMQKLRWYT